MQKQDISICIPFERNIYGLKFSSTFFLYLQVSKSYSGLNVTAFSF